MIRWCSFCQSYQGEVAPFDHYAITHGLCGTCGASMDEQEDLSRARHLQDLYRRLQSAGRGGEIPSASAVLDEGIALGLRPMDLVMGLVQPALYQVGQDWATGNATVANEHSFTAMASALIALVMYKYPEAQGYRQSHSPRVLLVAADGNHHTLGVQLVELVLITERVATFTVFPGIDADEVVQLWRQVRAPIVGFSIALPDQMRSVRRAVEAIVCEAPATRPRFLVGGYPVRCGMKAHPELPVELVADPFRLVTALEHSEIPRL